MFGAVCTDNKDTTLTWRHTEEDIIVTTTVLVGVNAFNPQRIKKLPIAVFATMHI